MKLIVPSRLFRGPRVALLALAMATAGVIALTPACSPPADNAPKPGKPGDNGNASGKNGGTPAGGANMAALKAAAAKGRAYLMSLYNSEDPRMAWGPKGNVGATGMVLNALLRTIDPVSPKDEKIKASLDFLISKQEKDGVWMSPQYGEAVYETAVVLRALVEAAKADADFKKREDVMAAIVKGRDYLLLAQVDENPEQPGFTAPTGPDDPDSGWWYGGWGYGRVDKSNRAAANMSTTHFAMDALDSTSAVLNSAEDQAKLEAARGKLQNFLRHCHNLKEYNGKPYNAEGIAGRDSRDPGEGKEKVMPSNDGGGVYSPGSSKAGYDVGEGGVKIARSYGSMSYALLKLYHMAHVPKTDMRVLKVTEWLTQAGHYGFAANPGFDDDKAKAGLYYYLFTAAWALEAQFGNDMVEDSKGAKHDWKAELGAAIASLQTPDGFWINSSGEFEEKSPMICTAYVLIALGSLK
ncbi:MAG: hypothetical protein AB7K09_19750 [Planctomycetota bacterium]